MGGQISYDVRERAYIRDENFKPLFFKNTKDILLFLNFMDKFSYEATTNDEQGE